MKPLLYRGRVVHQRLRPRRHAFRYPLFFLALPLERLADSGNAMLGINRPGLLSFRESDHGPRDGSPLLPWLRALLAREGLAGVDGQVVLLALPRVLGYAFKPVSFWLCHDRAGVLRAVLAEVNNTFGESHLYLVARPDGGDLSGGAPVAARKVFHVSPFFPVAGEYRFHFRVAESACRVRIDYHDRDGLLFVGAMSGRGEPLGARALLRAFLAAPWASLLVTAGIHWEALRLAAKRLPFFRKPHPPREVLTR